jgi:hypothetical protein
MHSPWQTATIISDARTINSQPTYDLLLLHHLIILLGAVSRAFVYGVQDRGLPSRPNRLVRGLGFFQPRADG